MRKIRLYKDIKIQWKVLTNKEAVPLEGRNLTFEIVNRFGRTAFPFVVDGNLLTADFPGTSQKTLGDYWVTLWENKGESGQSLVDSCAGFTLVSETCLEDDDDNTLNTEAVVEFDSNIQFGIKGDSAYEVWLKQGNAGSKDDFLAWLRSPAETAADKANAAASHAEEVAEELRKAEKVRENAESERKTAENARKSAEMERNEAELERKANETARASEFAKMKAESETATKNAQAAADRAESATIITGIDIDGEKGVITITAETGDN